MMQSKAHSKFDMPAIRRRAKTMVKKKHKVKIKLSDVDRIWKDFVEYGIIRPVLNGDEADVTNHFSVQLKTRKIVDDKRHMALMTKGLTISNGIVTKIDKVQRVRPGLKYILVMKDYKYKGSLVFQADDKFKKRINDVWNEGIQYFKPL